jgi:hypothetical protein
LIQITFEELFVKTWILGTSFYAYVICESLFLKVDRLLKIAFKNAKILKDNICMARRNSYQGCCPWGTVLPNGVKVAVWDLSQVFQKWKKKWFYHVLCIILNEFGPKVNKCIHRVYKFGPNTWLHYHLQKMAILLIRKAWKN